MSGSDSRRKRKEQRADGLDKRVAKETEEQIKKKKTKKRIWIATPIVVIVLAFIILMNTMLPYTALTAVQVGDTAYSAADFNYYYYTVYGNFQSTYSDMVDSLIDSSTPLDQQMFDDTKTWADYFTSMALSTMVETTALCDEAEKAGYTLSQEEQDDIDSQIESMSMYYPYYGYKSADQYFAAMYGKGMTAEVFRNNVEKVVLSDSYGSFVRDSKEFTDEEILNEYNTNQNNYDKIAYRYYYISSGATNDTAEDEKTTLMAEAEATAKAFAQYASTEKKFADKALELAADTDKATYEYDSATVRRYAVSSISSSYSEWLSDSAREYGDVTYIESNNGYGVLFYVGYDDAHYNTRNVRQILVQVGEDAEDEEAGTALSEAMATAEDYVKQFNDNGATEEAFSDLAKSYSYDGDTYKNGGLIESMYLGQMPTEIEDWVFDSSRKAGDVEIIKESDGLHIMYYIGEGGQYWSLAANNALQSAYYEEWRTALNEQYTAEEKFGMRFAAN